MSLYLCLCLWCFCICRRYHFLYHGSCVPDQGVLESFLRERKGLLMPDVQSFSEWLTETYGPDRSEWPWVQRHDGVWVPIPKEGAMDYMDEEEDEDADEY